MKIATWSFLAFFAVAGVLMDLDPLNPPSPVYARLGDRLRERRARQQEAAPIGQRSAYAVGDHEFNLVHEGRKRRYLLHVPKSYGPPKKMPLVLNFHGGGGGPEGHRSNSKMNEKSEEAGFLVAYPAGTGRFEKQKKLLTFNAGSCCGYAAEKNVDDVGFVKAVIEDIGKKFFVDRSRVYATGFSNGGYLAFRLACELSEWITAVAPVAGNRAVAACAPRRAVSILEFKMRNDPCTLYGGGDACGGCLGTKTYPCPSAKENIEYFVKLYGCQGEARSKTYDNAVCETFTGCKDQARVTLCSVTEGGHSWPGSGKNPLSEERSGKAVPNPKANDLMWDFFQQHTR